MNSDETAPNEIHERPAATLNTPDTGAKMYRSLSRQRSKSLIRTCSLDRIPGGSPTLPGSLPDVPEVEEVTKQRPIEVFREAVEKTIKSSQQKSVQFKSAGKSPTHTENTDASLDVQPSGVKDVEKGVAETMPVVRFTNMASVVSMVILMRTWVRNGQMEKSRREEEEKHKTSTVHSMLGTGLPQVADETQEKVHLSIPQKIKKHVTSTIIASDTWFYYWSSIVATGYLYNLFFVIGRVSFNELDKFNEVWFAVDYVTDAANLIDFLLHFRIGFLEDGIMIDDHKRLALNYIHSKSFPMDLAALVPTDILYFAFGTSATWLRLNRLLRYKRYSRFAEATESRSSFPNAFRIFQLILNIFVIFHWNGSVYFLLSRYVGFAGDTWVFRYERIINPSICINATIDEEGLGFCLKREEIVFSNLTKQYVFSLYWSALILTTIGEQQPPVERWEHIFVIGDILIGLLIFASIVGNVGTMITNMNASKTAFQENKDGSKTYISNRHVPKPLSRKTIAWFDYMWSQGQSLDEEAILEQLPTKLRAELAIQVHLETLQQVHIFKDCEPGLLVELVLKLKLQIMSPGDYICRKGDVGKEMYIVKRGSLNVVSEDGTKVFVTLKEGSVFGELSVMNIPGNKTGGRRSASIRSVGYSDLFVLTKDDLWDALREYPLAKEVLMEKGRAILRKDNLLDETAVGDALDRDVREKLELSEKKLRVADEEIKELYEDFIKTSNDMKRKTAELERQCVQLEKEIELYGLDLVDD